MIATKFCTCHDSTAVVACAKVYSNMMAQSGITRKWNSLQIWIAMEKLFAKRVSPALCSPSYMGPWPPLRAICSLRIRMLCRWSAGSMAICWSVSCNTCMMRAAWNITKIMVNFSLGTKNIFTFYVTPPCWHDTGSWNPSSSKTRTFLSYTVNIMGADVLATQEARASATMIFTMLNQNNMVPTH